MDALEPFDYSKGADFNSAFLSGYFADKYDKDDKKTFKTASDRINNSMYQLLASTVVGYATCVFETGSVDYKDSKAAYALLPVYIFSTKYHGEVYNFAMNGQTGKFAGDLPMDKAKVFKTILLVFIICFVIISLIAYMVVK